MRRIQKSNKKIVSLAIVACLIFGTLFSMASVVAEDDSHILYVDGLLSSDSVTYNPLTRSSGTGTSRVYNTLQEAANVVQPGDTVYVRGGVYYEQLFVSANGDPEHRITFKRYLDELVVLDGQNIRTLIIRVGRNDPSWNYGHYITIDGFTIKNAKTTSYSPENNAAGIGINVLGTVGVIIRNNHIYRDDYPGFPDAFVPNNRMMKGIFVQGYNLDTIVEYNTVHHVWNGIISRFSSGDVGGSPIHPIYRWNHVYFVNVETDAGSAQNNAGSISLSNDVINGVVEYNLAHHGCDGGIVTNENRGGHVIAYNIVYLIDPTDCAGNGPGIKTKAEYAESAEAVHHNIAFLNQAAGFVINAYTYGPTVYNNIAYKNFKKGFTVSGVSADPLHNSHLFNDIGLDNPDVYKDMDYNGNSSLFDYNFIGDGIWPVESNPHSYSSADCVPGCSVPGFLNLALLDIDSDGDLTPDILESLNYPTEQFMTSGGNVDTVAAIEYAMQMMKEVFGLRNDSILRDAGVFIPGYHCPYADDDPVHPMDPSAPGIHWFGEAPDIGAFEYTAERSEPSLPQIPPCVLEADAGGPYQGFVGRPIGFDGSLSTEPQVIVSYRWNFGDGQSTTSNGPQTTHIYKQKGLYTVTLAITDVYGRSSIDTTLVRVLLISPQLCLRGNK